MRRSIIFASGKRGFIITDDPVDIGNEGIIKEPDKVKSVEVGDILLMKGTQYPEGARGLWHKSPAKKYLPGGRVLNRLALKIDIEELRDGDADAAKNSGAAKRQRT